MKSFVCIVVLAIIASALAITEEQKEKIKQYHKDCLVTSKADKALVDKARQGDFVDDAKLKEHLFCFSQKAGFQTANGDILKPVLKTKIGLALNNDPATDKLIEKCAVKKATPQQTAFDAVKCFYENSGRKINLA